MEEFINFVKMWGTCNMHYYFRGMDNRMLGGDAKISEVVTLIIEVFLDKS